MKNIQVFDPSMCCSSGVCGTDVDQSLVAFSADLEWFKSQDIVIERFNLAQQPMAFAENPSVAAFLETAGEQGLPLTLIDGQIVLTGRYATREELTRWAGIKVNNKPEAAASSCCSSSCAC